MLFYSGSKYVLKWQHIATQIFMYEDVYNSIKWKLHEYWTVIEQLNKL